MLIGVCGKAGAGKDTIADYLVTYHKFEKIALADPIKRLVKDVFVLDDNTVYDRFLREQPLPQWDDWSVRKLLQFIGTELFRDNIDESIWVKSLWYRVEKDPETNYVVSDVRFPNELSFLQENGKERFFSIKVSRQGCDGTVGLQGHASEAYDLTADYELNNDNTFKELYSQVDHVLKTRGVK